MRTRPDTLTTIPLPSGTVTVDGHGYLTDPDHWSPDFAAHVADAEGITLTPRHMDIITFIRASLDKNGITPDARFVFKYLAEPDGLSKPQAKAALFDLFPYGYVKQAIKIAGMKQPRAWSTG
jgi:TusE/DsrC/DsvC family sulfur relay protein